MTISEEESFEAKEFSRRQLLAAGATGAAAAAVAGTGLAEAASKGSYPKLRVIALNKLKRNRPVVFSYPLENQASMLLDLGHAVPEGVGPKRSIVAYSLFCQHMGCPVEYQPKLREFVCPCHQSRYDPERLGSIIQGVAMQPLPRISLQVKGGAIWAVGVDGLIYGYRNNLHPGKRVGGQHERARVRARGRTPRVTG
jgi:arsenite oxidase small subunit